MAELKSYSCWILDIILKHCNILKHCYSFFFLDNKENHILQKNYNDKLISFY